MAEPVFRSCVHDLPRPVRTSGVWIEDASDSAKVVVKAAPGTNAAIQLNGVKIGTSADRLGALICGSRPNEWLLVGERSAVIIAVADLDTSGHMTVTDVSHGRSLLRLSGPDSARTLAKLCDIDLGDHMTPDGAVTTTTVAHVRCEIIRNDLHDTTTPERSYLLVVDSSYGDFFAHAVVDAMSEFA